MPPLNSEPRLVWQVGALLGEGPLWCPNEQVLRFVDIKGGKLHRFDPATSESDTRDVGGRPSFIVPAADGGFIVGTDHELRRFDGTELGEMLLRIDMPSHNRTNDATVDRAGRLWFGTMDDREEVPTGALHCFQRSRLSMTAWKAVVTNGPAVTGDGRTLYHVNSGERTIWRIPLQDGSCSDRGEVFIRLLEGEGYPDGVALDSEDCLWVALWDGWGIRRYAPDGTLLATIPLPCARVTKLAFGGPDLRTGFITTARTGLDDRALAAQPLAGGLFAINAPVAGRPLPSVILS
jgi:xylono-1,5-lactonase